MGPPPPQELPRDSARRKPYRAVTESRSHHTPSASRNATLETAHTHTHTRPCTRSCTRSCTRHHATPSAARHTGHSFDCIPPTSAARLSPVSSISGAALYHHRAEDGMHEHRLSSHTLGAEFFHSSVPLRGGEKSIGGGVRRTMDRKAEMGGVDQGSAGPHIAASNAQRKESGGWKPTCASLAMP